MMTFILVVLFYFPFSMSTTSVVCEIHVSPTRSAISAIEQAARVYEIRTGRFPDSLDQLIQPMGDRPALLDKKAITDAWGTRVSYKRTTDFFEIRSAGPDRVMNTEDDILQTVE